MKIKCIECGKEFKIPEIDCITCLSDIIGMINKTKDKTKIFDKINELVEEVATFEYKRGLHNAVCKNQLIEWHIINIGFKEIE